MENIGFNNANYESNEQTEQNNQNLNQANENMENPENLYENPENDSVSGDDEGNFAFFNFNFINNFYYLL